MKIILVAKVFIQFSEEILGKWTGKIIGLILTFFFIIAFATSANVMMQHLSKYFLPLTPFYILCLVYILVCMYGTFLGIEVVVRFSLLGFVMLIVLNITMVIGTFNDFQLDNLLPLLDKGIVENLSGSVYAFSDIAMGILGVAILYPMINNKQKSISLTFWAFVLSAIVIVMWPVFEIGVMGSDLMKRFVLCCMEQVRSAQFTQYLPRYELLMLSFFSFSIYVQSVAMFYCAKYSFKQITGIKKDMNIILPLTVVLFFLTYFMGNNENDFVNFLAGPWSLICAILSVGLPLILFITALFRGMLKVKPTE